MPPRVESIAPATARTTASVSASAATKSAATKSTTTTPANYRDLGTL